MFKSPELTLPKTQSTKAAILFKEEICLHSKVKNGCS
jgi:hypothetical protein